MCAGAGSGGGEWCRSEEEPPAFPEEGRGQEVVWFSQSLLGVVERGLGEGWGRERDMNHILAAHTHSLCLARVGNASSDSDQKYTRA